MRVFVVVGRAAMDSRSEGANSDDKHTVYGAAPATALHSEVNTVLVTFCFCTTGLDAHFEVTITHSDHSPTKALHSYSIIESCTFSIRRDWKYYQICDQSETTFYMSIYDKNTN